MLAVESGEHRLFFYPQKLAICQGHRRSHPHQLAGQRTLAKKVAFTHDRDRRFLSGIGHDRESHFAFLNIEDGIRPFALSEYLSPFRNRYNPSAFADGREESVRVELDFLFVDLDPSHVCALSHENPRAIRRHWGDL